MNNALVKYVIERLKERSTWLGVIGIVTAYGINMTVDQQTAVATAGIAVASVVSAFWKGN